MAANASVAMSVKDNLSSAIVGMKNSVTAFRTDVVELQKELDGLSATKVQMRMDLSRAKSEARDAQKAFEALGASATEAERSAAEAKWQEAEKNYENIRQQLDLVSRQARQTEKDMTNAAGAISKTDNRLQGGGVLSALGKAGLLKLGGDVAGQWAQALVGSAFGSEAGGLFSGALSGAMSGAALGAMVGAPVIGAAIGGGLGLLQGGAQAFQQRDDAYKSWYGGLYQQASAATEESLTSGRAIAGSREQTQIAFAHRFGSDEAATEYLDKTREMAKATNYTFDEITGYSKKLLNSYDPDAVFGVLQTLSDASAGLDLNSGDVDLFISGLSRMRTTGKATQEYLNYFSERGVDVYQALSNATGAEKSEIAGMVTKGDITGGTAAQAILDFIDASFGGLSEKLSGTYDAMVNNLGDLQAEIAAAMGTGYDETRMESVAQQLESYGGALGDALMEANTAIGAGRAALDNLKDRYTEEALGAVLLGADMESSTLEWSDANRAALQALADQYQTAMEDYEAGNDLAGKQIETYKEQAEALAQAQYDSSAAVMDAADTELELIDAIRDLTGVMTGWRPQYDQDKALSKGRGLNAFGLGGGSDESQTVAIGANIHAAGLRRVPYDNYAALLHEGERVLTAREARGLDAGGPRVAVQVTGNQFNVRSEADLPAIGDAIASAVERKLLAGVRG